MEELTKIKELLDHEMHEVLGTDYLEELEKQELEREERMMAGTLEDDQMLNDRQETDSQLIQKAGNHARDKTSSQETGSQQHLIEKNHTHSHKPSSNDWVAGGEDIYNRQTLNGKRKTFKKGSSGAQD